VNYLVRFDDICPTMNWEIWARVESVLIKYNIKPILAVVPDNQDPNLISEAAHADFWERVRAWQAAGWFIAIHGYQHLYETRNAGLLGINPFSEFSGLPHAEQFAKLSKAKALFTENGIRIDGWVAPAHSFDETTVQVLLELGIEVISDGFYIRPVKRLDALWIPQQMWRFRSMPFGVWTVCYHHNRFTDHSLKMFELDIQRYRFAISSVDRVVCEYPARKSNVLDGVFALLWLAVLRVKRSRGLS
jgi:predicted deacetylase